MNAKTDTKTTLPKKIAQSLIFGERAALARAITLVENTRPEDRAIADEVIRLCLPRSGNSIRLAITGAPGVGKSTFIESFGRHLIEKHRRRVAVLAVDPTSSKTRGSILGDKTRMSQLASHEQAFIRPSPSGSSQGGVAFRTREAMLLCEAAGYDTIIVETVGVGQSQIDVHSMVDILILLILPNGGDMLQGMKRGIVETADIIAITKADGENAKNAELARLEYTAAIGFRHNKGSGGAPKVISCSAIEDKGLDDVWLSVEQYYDAIRKTGCLQQKRRTQGLAWLKDKLHERMSNHLDYLIKKIEFDAQYEIWQDKLLSGEISPAKLAQKLMDKHYEKKSRLKAATTS